MGTRAIIAKIGPDGTGRRIRLAYDGYPTWAGAKLIQHYCDEATIETLIGLGAVYTLSDSPEHTPGAFLEWNKWDGLYDVTRTFAREGQGRFPEQPAEAVSGGLDGVSAGVAEPPYTYVWTPDGWFASYPAYTPFDDADATEARGLEFMPLLTLIHKYYSEMYADCEPGPPEGPNRIRCTVHDHGIQPLQNFLPAHLMPSDQSHPTYRLFPGWNRIQTK